MNGHSFKTQFTSFFFTLSKRHQKSKKCRPPVLRKRSVGGGWWRVEAEVEAEAETEADAGADADADADADTDACATVLMLQDDICRYCGADADAEACRRT